MSQLGQEGWVAIGVAVALLLSGVVGKVWKPLRQAVAAIDVIAGRPERYPGDDEATPNLAQRLDRIDDAITDVTTDMAAMRLEIDDVKRLVNSEETEWAS